MKTHTKYTAIEIERRWLVEPDALGPLDDFIFREIDDLYVRDSQLRLRVVRLQGQPPVYKFGKKYGKQSALSEATTNLYLSESEYEQLSQLPGERVLKRRYAIEAGALDLYLSTPAMAIFEVEFESEESASLYTPPQFVGAEVTGNPDYSGASIARSLAQMASP
jgi:CYTH domain-containing protein